MITPFINNVDYDAKGQREQVEYGNGVTTSYEYDPVTFRLTHLQTLRASEVLQNFLYTYDPVGNITHILDDAQQTIFFRNQRVEPSNNYTYDAVYRLIAATGREHLGQVGNQNNPPTAPDAFDAFHTGLTQPGDGNAMGTYLESYVYDAVGNILAIQHRGSTSSNPGWTRTYSYNEASLLEANKTSNRLSSTQVGSGPLERHSYDEHGSMMTMSHLPLMSWNYLDQLEASSQQVVNSGTPETTYHVYDSAGQRVRKVTERQTGEAETPTRTKERIYLGGFEIYREYQLNGSSVTLERETLHISDNQQQIALVETRTEGDDGSPDQVIRYQLSNHLGSATLELNEAAVIISHEEHYPFGATSFQGMNPQLRASAKRYRYTGKEKDEETGLYYHGARFYACWLGRWTACDPRKLVDGLNVYAYVNGRPSVETDPTGTYGEAGHYYVVYLASLAAGFDPNVAYRNAFYSQLPDDVYELEAVPLEQKLATKFYPLRWLGSPKQYKTQKNDVAVVHSGLHALTGGNADKETQNRRIPLTRLEPGSLGFGLALHAFGDSYSHRRMDDPSVMYSQNIGHLEDMHKPDEIAERPDLFKQYAADLYAILQQRSGTQPVLTAAQFSKQIEAVAALDSEEKQIQELKNLSQALIPSGFTPSQPTPGYQPEKFGGDWYDHFVTQSAVESTDVPWQEWLTEPQLTNLFPPFKDTSLTPAMIKEQTTEITRQWAFGNFDYVPRN